MSESQLAESNNTKIRLNASYHRLYDYPTFSSYLEYYKLLLSLVNRQYFF
jgi:hypothetical protein